MKKVIVFSAVFGLLIFSGCLDTVEEVSIKENGSGTYVTTLDMGKLMSMAKTMGGDSKEMKELENMKKDTLIRLKDLKDSLPNLSAAEKKIIEDGTLSVNINMAEEKFGFTFSFPFLKLEEIDVITAVLGKTQDKIVGEAMKDKFGNSGDRGTDGLEMFGKGEKNGDESGLVGTELKRYYTKKYEKNKISNKVNKDKVAKMDEDKGLTTLKEMSQMGMSMNMKTIINLPRPAKKAEGKGIKLSDDKKKITLEGTLDDFFEDASYFEYEIEY